MKSSICKLITFVTFGKVCLGWCKTNSSDDITRL